MYTIIIAQDHVETTKKGDLENYFSGQNLVKWWEKKHIPAYRSNHIIFRYVADEIKIEDV